MFYAKLITVGFANRSGFIRPRIPNVAMEVMDVIRFLLPNPKQFIQAAFECGAANRKNWQFFLQIITVYNAKFLDGMSRSPIRPMGTDGIIGIPNSVLQNILHIINKNTVCTWHGNLPSSLKKSIKKKVGLINLYPHFLLFQNVNLLQDVQNFFFRFANP